MMTEETKLDRETMNIIYAGKSLAKGKNMGTDKNGRDWKRYQTNWQHDDGKEIHCGCFDNFGFKKDGVTTFCKTLKDLEEGEVYNITYELSPFDGDDGTTKYAKKLLFVHDKKAEQKKIPATPEVAKKVEDTAKTEDVESEYDIVADKKLDIIENSVDVIENIGKKELLMYLGAVLFELERSGLDKLITKFNTRFKKEF